MKALNLFALALSCAAGLVAQTVPVQLIVTAEGLKGHEAPELTASDVMIRGNQKTFQVEDLVPLRGEHATMQLAIFIDDGSNTTLGLQFDDLKRFIREQPPSTEIGTYYIRNGTAVPTQAMTADRDATVKGLRLPVGQPGIASSPFLAISDFVKKWPAASPSQPLRREILLISSGIDLYRGTPTQNPYLQTAIEDCQRAHVLVNSIYFSAEGHGGHDYFLMNFGRDNLSYLGDETGGEAYWQGLSTSVSFQPYLEDLNMRFKHQYLLTLRAEPQKKAMFERIRLQTELHGIDLMAPSQAWIPAEK
jgi:hypothetical protein